jgi:hypothetical protein
MTTAATKRWRKRHPEVKAAKHLRYYRKFSFQAAGLTGNRKLAALFADQLGLYPGHPKRASKML